MGVWPTSSASTVTVAPGSFTSKRTLVTNSDTV